MFLLLWNHPNNNISYFDLIGVETFDCFGKEAIRVSPEAITKLTQQAFIDIAHLLRPSHLQQLSNILKDPAASVCFN